MLRNIGVAAVYTPKDFSLDAIMGDVVKVARRSLERRPDATPPDRPQPGRRRRSAAAPL